MELRVQWNPSQPFQAVTARVAAPAPPRPDDALQDTFNRLKEAEQLRQQGKLEAAQAICEELLRQHPNYWAALHTLGLVLVDRNKNAQALNYLVRAAMLDPRSWSTLTALADVYGALGAHEMAARTLEQAKAINPQDATILSLLGGIYREEREYEAAREAFRQALALDNDHVQAAVGLGWVYSYMGHNVEAAAVFEGLVKRGMARLEGFIEPGMAPLDVLAGLAELPAALVKIDVLSEIDKLIRDHGQGTPDFENRAAFVRVAALDRAGRQKEAWEQAVRANRALFPTMQNELRRACERENAMLAWLRASQIQTPPDADGKHPISLFILGPSRSGKTTMERLIASPDGVKRGYENPSVEIAVRRAFQSGCLLTSGYFDLLPAQLHGLCRDIYLDELARRAGSAKVFTNTHPARISDAGMMAATFPNVRFICMKRNVEDTILRMFQFKYRGGNFHAYDLKAARDHVLWYHQMIDLLAERLPDAVRIIHYEDMIADPAAARRTAAGLCGRPIPEAPVAPLGDDRGCAESYRQLLAAELAK